MPVRNQPVSHEAIMARLERGDEKFDRLYEMMGELRETVGAIHETTESTKVEVEKTKEIVEAWGAVKTMGKFLKWSSGLVAAAGVMFVFIRHVAGHVFKG